MGVGSSIKLDLDAPTRSGTGAGLEDLKVKPLSERAVSELSSINPDKKHEYIKSVIGRAGHWHDQSDEIFFERAAAVLKFAVDKPEFAYATDNIPLQVSAALGAQLNLVGAQYSQPKERQSRRDTFRDGVTHFLARAIEGCVDRAAGDVSKFKGHYLTYAKNQGYEVPVEIHNLFRMLEVRAYEDFLNSRLTRLKDEAGAGQIRVVEDGIDHIRQYSRLVNVALSPEVNDQLNAAQKTAHASSLPELEHFILNRRNNNESTTSAVLEAIEAYRKSAAFAAIEITPEKEEMFKMGLKIAASTTERLEKERQKRIADQEQEKTHGGPFPKMRL